MSPIWTLEAQVIAKRKVGNQIGNLTLNHKKLGIIRISLHEGNMPHIIGKLSTRATTCFQTSSQLKVYTQSYGPSNLWESQLWEFRDSHLRVSGQNDIWV
jgi:hypothetical protein